MMIMTKLNDKYSEIFDYFRNKIYTKVASRIEFEGFYQRHIKFTRIKSENEDKLILKCNLCNESDCILEKEIKMYDLIGLSEYSQNYVEKGLARCFIESCPVLRRKDSQLDKQKQGI